MTLFHRRKRRGGGGGGGLQPPSIFQVAIFRQKQVTFGQNHLIFGAKSFIFGSNPPPPFSSKNACYVYFMNIVLCGQYVVSEELFCTVKRCTSPPSPTAERDYQGWRAGENIRAKDLPPPPPTTNFVPYAYIIYALFSNNPSRKSKQSQAPKFSSQ